MLAGLTVLAVAGAVVLTQFIDPNNFRDDIEAAVRNASGRELRLKGKLELSWFPWLAITTRSSEIAGAPGTPTLVSWREARIGARVLPLAAGRLEIDRIRADGLTIHLHRDALGRANWTGPQAEQANTRSEKAVTIAGLDFRDASIDYIDERTGSHWRACHLALTSTALAAAQPVRAEGVATLSWRAGQTCETGISVNFAAELAAAIRGFEVHRLDLRLANSRLRMSAPKILVDTTAQDYRVSAWTLSLGSGKAQGGASRAVLGDAVWAVVPMTLDNLSPRQLAGVLGVALPRSRDATVLAKLSGEALFTARAGALEFKSERLQVDDSLLKGFLRRGREAVAPWEFDWQVDTLRLERYLPPRDSAAPPFKFPSEDLQKLQARGTLSIATLRWFDVVARDAQIVVELQDGELRTVPAPKP